MLGRQSEDLMFTQLHLVWHFGISRGKFPEMYGKADSEITYSFMASGRDK